MSELYTHRRESVHPLQSPAFRARQTMEGTVFFYTLLYTTCTLYLKRVHPVQVCLAVWVYLKEKKSMHLSLYVSSCICQEQLSFCFEKATMLKCKQSSIYLVNVLLKCSL